MNVQEAYEQLRPCPFCGADDPRPVIMKEFDDDGPNYD